MLESIVAHGTSGTLRLLIMQDPRSRSPLYWDMNKWKGIDCSYDEEDLSILYITDYWSHLDIVDWCKDHQIPIVDIDRLYTVCLARGFRPLQQGALRVLEMVSFDAGYEASSSILGHTRWPTNQTT